MICVSVVSHGQFELACAFLRTLEKLTPALVSQVIYTRNLDEPALPPFDLKHIRLTCISNDVPKGFGSNHNAAFERCHQPFFCVSNPDILLSTDPFTPLLALFSNDRLGLVAPRVITPDGALENTARLLYTPWELISQKLRAANHGPDAHWLAGMFLLFRASAFQAVGGFDTRYFLYIEDVDICTRLRVTGWELAQHPEAEVVHDARKLSHRSLKYTRWHFQGMLRYWATPSFWQYRRLLSRKQRQGSAV